MKPFFCIFSVKKPLFICDIFTLNSITMFISLRLTHSMTDDILILNVIVFHSFNGMHVEYEIKYKPKFVIIHIKKKFPKNNNNN